MTQSIKRLLRSTVLSAAVLGIISVPFTARAEDPVSQTSPATRPANATDVPVKVVVLFSSGVGYFEHAGSVKDQASTVLSFKAKQINDILKSLVLQDLGGGKVGTVVYPSQEPIGRLLASFQVDLSSNPSLSDLLNQLRGARVSVTHNGQQVQGSILGVEKKQKPTDKNPVDYWVMNLLTGGTIRSIPLEEVSRLDLEDKQLQEELEKALTALASARGQDKKPVTIHFNGKGDRLVRLGYVVETPIWKTSYRLLIGAEKATLQGWAIVENQTDNDWNNVQLSLVSGRPISFIQELYSPLYVPRPTVQDELYASLKPQTYEGGIRLEQMAKQAATPAPAAAPAAQAEGLRRTRRAAGGNALFGAASESAADEIRPLRESLDASASVASVASASQIGELFQYTVGDISLPRQRSAMIPIITDPIEVEKLSIYNTSVLPRHPLNGARVRNTTKKHLLQGPITVFEQSSYAGDAKINNVPPGQERLISYGIDLQMTVDPKDQKEESAIQTGRIVKGVLHLKRKNTFEQTYAYENKDSENKKTLIIEHPRRDGWKLIEPEKPMETTDALYRFKTEVAAGAAGKFPVRMEIVTGEELAILPMDFGTLDFYIKQGPIPQKVRDALAKAASMKYAMEDQQRQVQQRQKEINQISQDQTRIRENIKAAPDKSTLKDRLVQKLTEQESQIEDLYKRMDSAQKAFEKARKDLESYVANLDVE